MFGGRKTYRKGRKVCRRGGRKSRRAHRSRRGGGAVYLDRIYAN